MQGFGCSNKWMKRGTHSLSASSTRNQNTVWSSMRSISQMYSSGIWIFLLNLVSVRTFYFNIWQRTNGCSSIREVFAGHPTVLLPSLTEKAFPCDFSLLSILILISCCLPFTDKNYILGEIKPKSISTSFQLLFQHHLSLSQENSLPFKLEFLITKYFEELSSEKITANQFLNNHGHFQKTWMLLQLSHLLPVKKQYLDLSSGEVYKSAENSFFVFWCSMNHQEWNMKPKNCEARTCTNNI